MNKHLFVTCTKELEIWKLYAQFKSKLAICGKVREPYYDVHLTFCDSLYLLSVLKFKFTLIQIWKTDNIFVFIWKYHVKDSSH